MEVTYLLSKRAPKVRVSRGGGGGFVPPSPPRENLEIRSLGMLFSHSPRVISSVN